MDALATRTNSCRFARIPQMTQGILRRYTLSITVFSKYSDVENMYLGMGRRVLEDFPQLTLCMDEWIRFSHNFNNEMSLYIDSNVDENRHGNLAKRTVIMHSLYTRNNVYLRSAYRLVLDGQASAPANLLRSVFETVLAQYWVSLCKEEDVEKYMEKYRPNKK